MPQCIACLSGHVNSWQTQPILNGMSAGNLLLSAAILFSGLTYTKFAHLCEILNLAIMKERTFHTVQSNYLFPVVNRTWDDHQRELYRKYRGQRLAISGDGRCDSPGYSAKYCTYTMMLQESGEILNYHIVQVTETTSSVAMEKEGFKRCLDDLIAVGFNFTTLATDRHTGIAALSRTEYPQINHQFDVWHVAKGLMKKLTKAAKQKDCHDLSLWTKSICNHLWWSCQTCESNALTLKEKWISVLHHSCNEHTWGDSEIFTACAHPPLEPEKNDGIKWLSPESASHKALQSIVLDKHLIKALSQMTEANHTGDLEVYHSVLLKYCEKRSHFSHDGMVARTALAALDNNHNIGRQHARTQTGELRYKVAYPKGRRDWVAKPITEDKSYHYITDMMTSVVALRCSDTSPSNHKFTRSQLPTNIAPVPRPPKHDVIAKHRSRFS